MPGKHKADLAKAVHDFVRDGFKGRYGQLSARFPSSAVWRKCRSVGSELWLDSGDIGEIEKIWTQEFSAVTTNNTLLNREVQKGTYDDLIVRAASLLDEFDLSPDQRRLEIAFILNARHALRLVETFDAFVSVEQHTDTAFDVERTVEFGRRYFAVCPERFYVKVPFTPAGLLAARKLSGEGVRVNQTLGFSARQSCLSARIAQPHFVNVFLGRLNSFVADNDLGDGNFIGEKATVAAQAMVRKLRKSHGLPTRQIAASFRQGRQVLDLVGVDVLTIPPKVAREFLDMNVPPEQIENRTDAQYQPRLREGFDPRRARIDTLWDVSQRLVHAIDELAEQDLDRFTPDEVIDFLAIRGCGGVLARWSEQELAISYDEGKIPRFDTWMEALGSKQIGLDTLMNLAGLNSFAKDQKEMDQRVAQVLERPSTRVK